MKDSDHTNKIPNIWVDADACPSVIKDMLFRASHRTGVAVTLVANHYLSTPPSPVINALQVPAGFDVADNEIVRRCRVGDLVITGDIPLADEVISAGCLALSPRGELFSTANIKSRLAMRDFMETMRSSGIPTQGPAPLDSKDKQRFANQLDQWLRRQC